MPGAAPAERADATRSAVARIDVGGPRPQPRTLRTRRVGATRRADVAPTVVALLEAGAMQSATHVEEMVLDMASLASRVFPFVELDREQLAAAPFVQRMRFVGSVLAETVPLAERDPDDRMWISDTVRGWCAMAVAADPGSPLDVVVAALVPYADDPHSAVREWAWLALRPRVVKAPYECIEALRGLVGHSSGAVRRFAVEATRPRSVWGARIQQLKQHPETAESFLDALGTYIPE